MPDMTDMVNSLIVPTWQKTGQNGMDVLHFLLHMTVHDWLIDTSSCRPYAHATNSERRSLLVRGSRLSRLALFWLPLQGLRPSPASKTRILSVGLICPWLVSSVSHLIKVYVMFLQMQNRFKITVPFHMKWFFLKITRPRSDFQPGAGLIDVYRGLRPTAKRTWGVSQTK